eukprot:8923513-Alexandrium_andersonii.AAC.1
MSASLVGSEMCIRDSAPSQKGLNAQRLTSHAVSSGVDAACDCSDECQGTVSYTHLTLPTICSV